MQDEPSLPEIH